jgi:hypothetical protein
MDVTIHAILLLAIPVATAMVYVRGPRRTPSKRRPLFAAIIAVGMALLVLAINTHLCYAGDPWAQCLIIGVCLWAVLTYQRGGLARLWLSVVLVGLMLGLSFQYVNLVHSSGWYGHPHPSPAVKIVNDSRLAVVRVKVEEAGVNNPVVYPEGWLRQMPCVPAIAGELKHTPYRVEIGRAWHSWYTRIFPVHRIAQDFWFPGGRLGEGGGSITLRDAP